MAIPFSSVYAISAANTAVTTTLAAAPGARRVIQSVTVSASGAASPGPITLAIVDGATTIYQTDLTLTEYVPQTITPGVGGSLGNAVAITASAGATGTLVKLNVQYTDYVPTHVGP